MLSCAAPASAERSGLRTTQPQLRTLCALGCQVGNSPTSSLEELLDCAVDMGFSGFNSCSISCTCAHSCRHTAVPTKKTISAHNLPSTYPHLLFTFSSGTSLQAGPSPTIDH